MALKSARVVDSCGKSSGFEDFDNTVGRGSAVIFDANSGLCLSYVRILGPKRNLDHKSFFTLGLNVKEFIQIRGGSGGRVQGLRTPPSQIKLLGVRF